MWQSLCRCLNNSEFFIFTTTILISYFSVFWSFNGFLLYIESHETVFEKYRLQKKKPKLNKKHQPSLWYEIMRKTIVNQITTILLIPILFYALRWRGLLILENPHFTQIITHLLIFIFSEDALFFWSHYLLHTNFLFKKIHVYHHKFKQPIGLTSVLAHPVESFLGNQLPVWFAPILVRDKHMITICIWVAIRLFQTINAHSGYDLPYINPCNYLPWLHGGSQFHDYHHRKVDGNYGSFFTLWDRLMGTYREEKLYNKNKEINQ